MKMFLLLLLLSVVLSNKVNLDVFVTNRLVHATGSVEIDNPQGDEVKFTLLTSNDAYLSSYYMTVGDTEYYGVVGEKEESQRRYDESEEDSAGLVTMKKVRDGKEYTFEGKVKAGKNKTVKFDFQFEQLLLRKFGAYDFKVGFPRASDNIKGIDITVDIVDDDPINKLDVGGADGKILWTTGDKRAVIQSTNGIGDTLTASYGVKKKETLCFSKGQNYFVHSFPVDVKGSMTRLPRSMVYVIDISGSMAGEKLQQTKTAFITIIKSMEEKDMFGIVLFDNEVESWKNELVVATDQNKQEAIEYVKNLRTRGSTNMYGGISKGLEMLDKSPTDKVSSLIVLTDGEANEGIRNPDEMIKDIKKNYEGATHSIYTLWFGDGNNEYFQMLDKVAKSNNGFARRIWTGKDAANQLEGFFFEIEKVVLRNVEVSYKIYSPDVTLSELTNTKFHTLHDGQDVVIAGKLIKEDAKTKVLKIDATITAKSAHGDFHKTYQAMAVFDEVSDLRSDTEDDMPQCDAQMIFVMKMIDELLDDHLLTNDEETFKKALSLSIENSLMTDITAMFVEESKDMKVVDVDITGSQKLKRKQHTNIRANIPVSTTTATSYKFSNIRTSNPNMNAHASYGGGCFEVSSMIKLKDGSEKSLGDIESNDIVESFDFAKNEQVFSKVLFVWEEIKPLEIMNIQIAGQKNLKVTENHYMYRCKRNQSCETVIAALLKEGDWTLGPNGLLMIESITYEYDQKVRNVYTESGVVVVDGVVASCLTKKTVPWVYKSTFYFKQAYNFVPQFLKFKFVENVVYGVYMSVMRVFH